MVSILSSSVGSMTSPSSSSLLPDFVGRTKYEQLVANAWGSMCESPPVPFSTVTTADDQDRELLLANARKRPRNGNDDDEERPTKKRKARVGHCACGPNNVHDERAAEREKEEAEAQRKAQEEEEEQRKALEEAQRKDREEEEQRKALEEAQRKAREEAQRKAQEQRKAREEAQRKDHEEQQRKAQEQRKAREEAQRKAHEEQQRKARKEEAREAEAKAMAEGKAILEEPDAYKVLGVTKHASPNLIKKVQKKLARVHHPDKFRTQEGKDQANEVMAKIGNACDVLSNQETKRKYDRGLLKNWATGNSRDSSSASSSPREETSTNNSPFQQEGFNFSGSNSEPPFSFGPDTKRPRYDSGSDSKPPPFSFSGSDSTPPPFHFSGSDSQPPPPFSFSGPSSQTSWSIKKSTVQFSSEHPHGFASHQECSGTGPMPSHPFHTNHAASLNVPAFHVPSMSDVFNTPTSSVFHNTPTSGVFNTPTSSVFQSTPTSGIFNTPSQTTATFTYQASGTGMPNIHFQQTVSGNNNAFLPAMNQAAAQMRMHMASAQNAFGAFPQAQPPSMIGNAFGQPAPLPGSQSSSLSFQAPNKNSFW